MLFGAEVWRTDAVFGRIESASVDAPSAVGNRMPDFGKG